LANHSLAESFWLWQFDFSLDKLSSGESLHSVGLCSRAEPPSMRSLVFIGKEWTPRVMFGPCVINQLVFRKRSQWHVKLCQQLNTRGGTGSSGESSGNHTEIQPFCRRLRRRTLRAPHGVQPHHKGSLELRGETPFRIRIRVFSHLTSLFVFGSIFFYQRSFAY
jgi:hypothetical protein